MRKEATQIVKRLQDAGYEAYFAGGSVRDLLLEVKPKDIDIATSALPEQVEAIFDHTIPVGKQFGIIIVRENGHNFDVATFRTESDYSDNRRPQKVEFSSAEQDAKRRDFTINGLYFDPIKNSVVDFVNGQEDIKKHLIRFIGDPDQRINEDHLRIIRAVRFKITLNFQYEEKTFESIRQNAELIKSVSAERIRNELNRIFANKNRAIGLVELSESKILDQILPEIEMMKSVAQPPQYHLEGDVFTHTYLALKSLAADAPLHLVWATLLHDVAKPTTEVRINGQIVFHDHAKVSGELAKKILNRLKFSRIEINTICWMIENHMKIAQINELRAGKKSAFLLDNRFEDLLELAKADTLGTYPPRLELLNEWQKSRDELIKEKEKYIIKNQKLKIFSGDDMVQLGFKPDKKFKEVLEEIQDLILEDKLTSSEQAREYAKKFL